MNPLERVIPPVVADDGSVHYSSVLSLSRIKGLAICPMIPDRMIPVIFVPGIMGSNLAEKGGSTPVWLLDGLTTLVEWTSRGPDQRKLILDPHKTDVFTDGTLPKGTDLSDAEKRRRGWGEVAAMSYGDFLVWLENALNDVHAGTEYGRKGLRSQLMNQVVCESDQLPLLEYEEVAMSYRYQFPVHAVGYNWLQSNVDSAARLLSRIREFTQYYRDQKRKCEKVILVTHSMGGLVARYCTGHLGGALDVLGVVHGVMPATGAAAAYKRVKAGTEGSAGLVLGDDAAKVTAVFAQAPGALQLLPSTDYGMGWLRVRDFERVVSLPKQEPYSEIYLKRGNGGG